MSDVSLLSLSSPISPPLHVDGLPLSLSYPSLNLFPSLSSPISLPQHGRSEFSWEGINVSVVTPFLHLPPSCLFDLTGPLATSTPLPILPLTAPRSLSQLQSRSFSVCRSFAR